MKSLRKDSTDNTADDGSGNRHRSKGGQHRRDLKNAGKATEKHGTGEGNGASTGSFLHIFTGSFGHITQSDFVGGKGGREIQGTRSFGIETFHLKN